MRRTPPRQRPLPSGVLRGGERLRLVSLITMLLLIIFLMYRMRDPAMWRWLVPNEPEEAAQPEPPPEPGKPAQAGQAPDAKEAQPASPETAALESGVFDTDPEEKESFDEEVQAVDDNTLHIKEIEMPAYDRLVRWSARQSVGQMYHRAVSERPNLTLNDFVQHRKALRGKLVYLDLNVRLVQKADVKTSDGYELYELWGFTTESGSWLYCVMAVGLPKDIDVGARVEQHVRVAGYFLKLQGYYPALGKPNDMHFAPMVIGRAWRVVPPPPLAKENLSVPLALGVLGGFVALLAAWAIWGVVKKRRKGSVRPVAAGGGRTLPIDDWFERAEAGNNPQGIPDSSHRPSGRNGDGNGEAAPFPDGLDSGPSKSE